MNRFKLVVTMLLIMGIVGTSAFAVGKGGVKQQSLPVGGISKDVEASVPLSARMEVKKADPFRGQLPAPSSTTAGLTGTLRIGVGKTFPTIGSALTSLAINGLAGPVTFYL